MNINDNEIESVLRKAPQPKPPAGLKQQLTAQITLLAAANHAATLHPSGGLIQWLRRWWPALAPATVSLACATTMVVQQIEARGLRLSNEGLAKQLAEEVTTVKRQASADHGQGETILAGAAAEGEEIARLKERVAELGSEVARLERLQAENETLRRQPVRATGLSEDELAALAKAREKAQFIACINNLKQIGLAVKMWALDNKDVNPPNFLSMSNELSTPKILICPAETNRIVATAFAKYTDENCSYEYLTPSAADADTEPQRVQTRCPIHGHIGLCDGSVQAEVAKKHPERLIWNDQKLYLDSAAPGRLRR